MRLRSRLSALTIASHMENPTRPRQGKVVCLAVGFRIRIASRVAASDRRWVDVVRPVSPYIGQGACLGVNRLAEGEIVLIFFRGLAPQARGKKYPSPPEHNKTYNLSKHAGLRRALFWPISTPLPYNFRCAVRVSVRRWRNFRTGPSFAKAGALCCPNNTPRGKLPTSLHFSAYCIRRLADHAEVSSLRCALHDFSRLLRCPFLHPAL